MSSKLRELTANKTKIILKIIEQLTNQIKIYLKRNQI